MTRYCWGLILVLVVLAAPMCYAATTDGITIVNKANLPPARLAEAIAAKAVCLSSSLSDEQKKLLLTAANTDPSNPAYPYLLARLKIKMVDWNKAKADYSFARPFLQRSLKSDPSYLPTLYMLAMIEPTHERRMESLQRLTVADAGNAQPYYLMAMDTWLEISKGRKITQRGDLWAFDVSLQEWDQVSDLIEKGNRCTAFVWRSPATPSVRDIRISFGGRQWPERAVESYAQMALESTATSFFSPQAISSGASWRQLAKQARWAAKRAHKDGDSDRARRYLNVMMRLSHRYAGCKPERIVCFYDGRGMWGLAESTAEEIAKAEADADSLAGLKKRKEAWCAAVDQCKALLDRTCRVEKDLKLPGGISFLYNDYAAEEEGVRKIVAGLRP